MGLIKNVINTVSGALADQYLEAIEPYSMSGQTVMTVGVAARKSNNHGSPALITDGSIVQVYPNMMMLLVDGGKIVDYTAEEGYYTVSNEKAPSMFNGDLDNSVREAFFRFKFGGITPQKQFVLYINLQEIKGIKFGTATPLQYFDNFYHAELFLRTHGTYSIRITDPISFYVNAIPKNKLQVEIFDINDQYLQEFMMALNGAINQYSADGERISYLSSKGMDLAKYLAKILDEDWKQLRGIEVVSVALASISYTEESQKLLNMRNQGAMLSDPNIQAGYMQSAAADAMKIAAGNKMGTMDGVMNVALAANQANSLAAAINPAPASDQQAAKTDIKMACESCGAVINLSEGIPKFCPECGKPFVAKPISAS